MAVNWKSVFVVSAIINLVLLGLLIYFLIKNKKDNTPSIVGGCTSNHTCPVGQSCINGTCQPFTPPTFCVVDKNCSAGYRCMKTPDPKIKKCVPL